MQKWCWYVVISEGCKLGVSNTARGHILDGPRPISLGCIIYDLPAPSQIYYYDDRGLKKDFSVRLGVGGVHPGQVSRQHNQTFTLST